MIEYVGKWKRNFWCFTTRAVLSLQPSGRRMMSAVKSYWSIHAFDNSCRLPARQISEKLFPNNRSTPWSAPSVILPVYQLNCWLTLSWGLIWFTYFVNLNPLSLIVFSGGLCSIIVVDCNVLFRVKIDVLRKCLLWKELTATILPDKVGISPYAATNRKKCRA